MKSKLSFILLVFCALLALTACQSTQAPDPAPVEPPPEAAEPEAPSPEPETPAEPTIDSTLSQRDQDWIEDIEYLREGYKEKHLDPFYLCSEEEFNFKLDQLRAKVAELSDEDIVYEIKAVIAGMMDGHTSVDTYAPHYERRLPVSAVYFGDRLYLTAYLEGYEQFAPYLLHEIVSVNGIDTAYLDQKGLELIKPQNRWSTRERSCRYFSVPAFLDWAGCDYQEGYTFQILNDNQEVESVEAPVITGAEFDAGTWVYPENWDQVLCMRGGDWAEYFEGENGGFVYMSLSKLNSRSSLDILVDSTVQLLAEHPECAKLVVDLRQNTGGDLGQMGPLPENAESLRTDQTYVLIDGSSASAAITLVEFFKNELDAVSVGEPTGQFTSFFYLAGAAKPPVTGLVLPNSQLSIYVSEKWADRNDFYWADPAWGCDAWEPIAEEYYDEDGKLYEWEYAVLPDVYIHQEIEDVRQGKDSVIEWVLAQEK